MQTCVVQKTWSMVLTLVNPLKTINLIQPYCMYRKLSEKIRRELFGYIIQVASRKIIK